MAKISRVTAAICAGKPSCETLKTRCKYLQRVLSARHDAACLSNGTASTCGVVYNQIMTFPADFLIDLSHSPNAQLRPAPIGAVTLTDTFWEPRRVINRENTLFEQFEKLESSGVLDNFRRAAGREELGFRGRIFSDTDLYKWLEAAATTLGTHPTPALEALVNQSIELIENAQCADGYLDTAFMFERATERWVNLCDDHEMYCAGHFIQAAIAYFRATNAPRLLNVARKLADHIDSVFGPQQRHGGRAAIPKSKWLWSNCFAPQASARTCTWPNFWSKCAARILPSACARAIIRPMQLARLMLIAATRIDRIICPTRNWKK